MEEDSGRFSLKRVSDQNVPRDRMYIFDPSLMHFSKAPIGKRIWWKPWKRHSPFRLSKKEARTLQARVVKFYNLGEKLNATDET